MKKKYTLKELADIGVLESAKHSNHQKAREAFTKAILDTIGFELPKDEEREAFDAWWGNIDHYPGDDDEVFAVWKAGREELRRAQMTAKEPGWIPWAGGECPLPDTVKRWEIKAKNGAVYLTDRKPSTYLWWHSERDGFSQENIVAYRVIEE